MSVATGRIALAVGLLSWLGSCSPGTSVPEPNASAPAAKLQAPTTPGLPPTVVLGDDAFVRLGVATAPVERLEVKRTLLAGAEVVVPPGQQVVVSAPIAGKLTAAAVLRAGSRVEAGVTVFELVPMLSPERDVLTPAEHVQLARVRADLELAAARARGDRDVAGARVNLARIAVERAEALVRSESGSVRARDEARAELAQAEGALAAASSSLEALETIQLEPQAGSAIPLALASPLDGRLLRVLALPDQMVPAGAPLFEVASLERVWLRVPIFAGDAPRVRASESVEFGGLAGRADSSVRRATPVAAPPSANANAGTIDLWFELDNADGALRPGERGTARLPLTGDEALSGVPWSAVIHDIHGDAWVYVETAPRHYTRSRVEVERIVSGPDGSRLAALARGPADGTQVVVAGAVELHGFEFGADK